MYDNVIIYQFLAGFWRERMRFDVRASPSSINFIQILGTESVLGGF